MRGLLWGHLVQGYDDEGNYYSIVDLAGARPHGYLRRRDGVRLLCVQDGGEWWVVPRHRGGRDVPPIAHTVAGPLPDNVVALLEVTP